EYARETDSYRLLERVILFQLTLEACKKRLDVRVRHRPPKSPPREVAKNPLGINQRLLRNDLHAFWIIGTWNDCLLQVSKNLLMADRRPRVEQGSFNFNPLDHQTRPLVLVRAHFLNVRRLRRQSIRHNANRALR